ncbi:MAG: zinc ribbon domain-containing protein [Defluviitaleaceae bacterium]|nr:zinc ribbon domain-containing protein [Defluviitaleaceae bacterium]
MAFFEEIGKKISKSGQDAAQKAKNMAETVRLNGLISEEERRVKSAYTEIGKVYYESFKSNPDQCFAAFIAEIDNANENIKLHSDQIRQIKGITTCTNCGGEVPNSAPFCSSCGTKLEVATVAVASGPVCANCGAVLSPNQGFCTDCGTKVSEPPVAMILCTNCSQELGPEVVFCLNCGTKKEA